MNIQRSPEWFAERAGRVTGSRIADMLARTKKGWGAPRGHYLWDLVAERLAGAAIAAVNPLAWGLAHEAEGKAAYALMTNMSVIECGFVPHPTILDAGSSPDALIGDDGLLELKCPTPETHLAAFKSGEIPEDYLLQCHWAIACTGRKWCDFASYDPRMPGALKLWVKRVPRDEELVVGMEVEVRRFLAEVSDEAAAIAALAGA